MKDSTEAEESDSSSPTTTTIHDSSVISSFATFSNSTRATKLSPTFSYSSSSSSNNLTNLIFKRHPINTKKRTIYTDILKNIGKKRMPFAGDFNFRQRHKIRYFEGSHPDTVPRNRSMIPETDHYDITMISQTS